MDINHQNQEMITSIVQVEEGKLPTPFQDSLQQLLRDARAMISAGAILFFALITLLGPSIYHHLGSTYRSVLNGQIGPDVYHSFDHEELNRQDELPSAQYWLGTDELGRDILARLMQGLIISLVVAILVAMIEIMLGTLVGILAGYYGGLIDQLLSRFTDFVFAFPGILLVILISGILDQWADDHLSKIPVVGVNGNARLVLASLVLAFTTWPLLARYVRAQTLQLKKQQFIEAARCSGSSNTSIILHHILPNVSNIITVVTTLHIPRTIIYEAGISFLGLGVRPPGSSIGLMIAGSSALIGIHPWEVLAPSIVLVILVLAFSFFGDGLNNVFNPRCKD